MPTGSDLEHHREAVRTIAGFRKPQDDRVRLTVQESEWEQGRCQTVGVAEPDQKDGEA
jgi:hypothetical protein